VISAALFLSVSLKRTRVQAPFEMIRSARLTSSGKESKAAISPDGRYIAHSLFDAGQESLRVRQAMKSNDTEIVPPQPIRYGGITFSLTAN
jgi:hypothetical protein